jgi:hypothetical protein
MTMKVRSQLCIAFALGSIWISIGNVLALAQAPVDDNIQPTPDQLAFFENKIRPVLVEHCYGCHSRDAVTQGKLKGSLLLDSRDGMLRGGDSGPSLVAGQKHESLILKALRYEDYEMPPAGKLPQSVIDDFERWIEDGAVDPRLDAHQATCDGLGSGPSVLVVATFAIDPTSERLASD